MSVRLSLVLSLAVVVGCTGDSTSGRAFSPPGGGNQTLLTYAAVSVGGFMTCALANGGRALCWGRGTLGDGRTNQSGLPVPVTGFRFFRSLSVAGGHACGVTTNGVASCWGSNPRGALGDGTTESSLIPVDAKTDLRFTTIATASHTCAVSTDGDAYCWGPNKVGELGIASDDTMSLVPARVVGGLLFAEISTGFRNSCGLTTDGAAYCWGDRWGTTPQPVPTALRFQDISMGSQTICAVTAAGAAYCWGVNSDGQFGNGTRDDRELDLYHTTPIRVESDLTFSLINTGHNHVCAVAVEGGAYCWGSDLSGQIGDGVPPGEEDENKLFPTRVKLSREFQSIGAGGSSSCAVTTGGEAYCWGWQAGDPSSPQSSDVPVRVGG